jgi:hypothetical protein
MSIKLQPWYTGDPAPETRDGEHHFKRARERRQRKIDGVMALMANVFAVNEGFPRAGVSSRIETLFSTFAGEWYLFQVAGSDSIATAILTDATIAWLDTDVGGTPLRTRLANRLS